MALLTERLDGVLLDLKKVDGIECAAVATRDGLLMSANMLPGTHPETFAAMSATMLSAAEIVTSELKKGFTNRIIVESKDCRMIATGSGPKSFLVVLTKANSGFGLTLVEVEKGARRINEILE